MPKKSKKSTTQSKKERTAWDDSFKNLHQAILNYWGLQMLKDVKLGKLHPEADMVIITPHQGAKRWKKHPLWQFVSTQNVIEFKSIRDRFQWGHFEKLLVYTLLYRIGYKIPYHQKLSAWLILPNITPTLKKALKHYQIVIEPVYKGLWRGDCLFPLYVVEYNHLPVETPFASLKIFMKSGKPLQEVFKSVLELEEEVVITPIQEAMELIHPFDVEEVLNEMKMTLSEQRAHLKETKRKIVREEFGDELAEAVQKQVAEQLEQKVAEQLEQKAEQVKRAEKMVIASQMKIKGFEPSVIAELTGLTLDEIEEL